MVDFLPSTRPELLKRLHASLKIPSKDWSRAEHGAWTELAQRYQLGLSAYCRTKRLDAQTTEEVVQDTLVRVRSSLHGFSHRGRRGQFRGWLIRVLNSRIIDLHRRAKRRGREIQAPSSVLRRRSAEHRARDPHDELVASQQTDALFTALVQLRVKKPRDYELVIAVKLDLRTVSDVAQELGMNEEAAKTALRRALEKLAKMLPPEGRP